ncbi:MAG: hypothetical protein AAF212_01990 [Verrucomicrobiota bacterium]
MSQDPADDESEVPIETAESEEEISLSEDAIESIVGDAAKSQDERDPEEVTADQVDALKDLMGSAKGEGEDSTVSENVDPEDIASILEAAGEEDSPESQDADLEVSEGTPSAEPAREPEEASADQIDALAGMMGGFDSEAAEEPTTETEKEAPQSDDATADQVDALAGMMGGFGAEQSAADESTAGQNESEKPEAEEPVAEEPEAPTVPETVDADDIASILAAESPEVEETPEEESPTSEGRIDPGNVAVEEGILTPDILEKLILTHPDDTPEPEVIEAPAPKVSAEEVSNILGDEEIEDVGDDEKISPEELAKLMDAEAEKAEEPEPEPEPELEPEPDSVPDEAANIVTPGDDLEEEEELAKEEPEIPPEPEDPPETSTPAPSQNQKRKRFKWLDKVPGLSKASRILKPAGFVASVSTIAMISSFIVIKIAAPKPGGSGLEYEIRQIPIIGSESTLPITAIQPAIDKALEPYLNHFEIDQGWIHVIAHSGGDVSASVSLTAITKEPLFEILADEVLLNRLVLTPNRFDTLRKELLDEGKAPGPERPEGPAERYIRERFTAGYATRVVLNFYGKPDGSEWTFYDPQWEVADFTGKLPTGFKEDFLGSDSMHLDDPRVNAWVEEYNDSAKSLLGAAQSSTELENLAALQKRVDDRLRLFDPFEILSGRMYTVDSLDRGVSFNAIITDVYEDGFFEGYFEMRDFGRDAKRFSGRVAVDRGPNGELIQTAHLRTFRESGLDGSTDSSIPRLFSKGFQDSISLVSEPGFLSGRLDDMYITLAKP